MSTWEIIRLLLLIGVFGGYFSCQQSEVPSMSIEGKTMGTSYHITIYDQDASPERLNSLKTSIDSLLKWINLGISTYERSSLISRFNQCRQFDVLFPDGDTTTGALPHFFANLEVAHETYAQSHGFFDPTVMKLVNYWGFGYTGRVKIENPDSAIIKSILQSTGMDKVSYRYSGGDKMYTLHKSDSMVELDFGGIGQGYGADQIAHFLDQAGYRAYLAEVGGEMVARGRKPDGQKWSIGLNTPVETAPTDDIFSKVYLSDAAITTSGNYRNFYTSGAQTYSHTINPRTGFPQRSTLLSVTLVGRDCTHIDAMATACMTVGMDSCSAIILRQNMEAYYIFRDGDSLRVDMTPGFGRYLEP